MLDFRQKTIACKKVIFHGFMHVVYWDELGKGLSIGSHELNIRYTRSIFMASQAEKNEPRETNFEPSIYHNINEIDS